MTDPGTEPPQKRTIIETIEVAGGEVIDRVRDLVKAGNVRTLRIEARESDFSLEMPVTVGVIVGGAVVLTAPWLALLGVVAGLVSKVSIEVERDDPGAANKPEEPHPTA
jgi:hypothetical protein